MPTLPDNNKRSSALCESCAATEAATPEASIMSELEALRRLLQNADVEASSIHGPAPQEALLRAASAASRQCPSQTFAGQSVPGLLIAKAFPGITPEVWNRLCRECGLKGWAALPLESCEANPLEPLVRQLERAAFGREHDLLTSLPNRAFFERMLRQEMERAGNTGGSISLAMLDLDGFTALNKSFGQEAGDRALQAFAGYFTAHCKSYDVIARWEGDAFTVLMPGTSVRQARAGLERILNGLKNSPLVSSDNNGGGISLCFSAGVCGAGPENGYAPVEEMLRQAEDAMLEARKTGGARVCLSPDGSDPLQALVGCDEKQFLFNFRE